MKSIKPHIGIYGRCNAGKSTLLNFLLGEPLAIVSEERGTTTDPVRKSFEILGFAPVVAIDTAGYDDKSQLGVERIAKTMDTLHHIDLAVILYRGEWSSEDSAFLDKVKAVGVDYIIIKNCIDGYASSNEAESVINTMLSDENERNLLFDAIRTTLPEHSYNHPSMLGKYIKRGDVVVMICPIDSEAPAGRLILPQMQAIRDALDNEALSIVIQPQQLPDLIAMNINPALVVTDSQVIDIVMQVCPPEWYNVITTFSILLAELKGDIALYKEGLERVKSLKKGDKILVMESCVHQTSCDDIGRVKIPAWLDAWVGEKLEYNFLVGLSPLPDNLESYSLVVQCGGCMVTTRQLKSRITRVKNRGVAITNYGMLIKMIRG